MDITSKPHCQRAIEGKSPCIDQCDHCREYFKPVQEQGGKTLRWVKLSERFPIKRDNYDWKYDDRNEPSIIFVNRVHDATFVWFHSIGWDIKDHSHFKEQAGWDLSQWEWLEEYTPPASQPSYVPDTDRHELDMDLIREFGPVSQIEDKPIKEGAEIPEEISLWIKEFLQPYSLPEARAGIETGAIGMYRFLEPDIDLMECAMDTLRKDVSAVQSTLSSMKAERDEYRKTLESVKADIQTLSWQPALAKIILALKDKSPAAGL